MAEYIRDIALDKLHSFLMRAFRRKKRIKKAPLEYYLMPKFGKPPAERRHDMPARSISGSNNGTAPQDHEQMPPVIDSNALRLLEELAAKIDKEGQKTTTQLAKSYQRGLSQRIQDLVGGTSSKSIIDVGRGILGRKDPTDLARQRAAKTIEDLTKLTAYLQANQARFGDYGHQILVTARQRIADRNYSLTDELRDYGYIIELICSGKLLSTYEDCLDQIKDIGMTEIARSMPRR
jgi:hypothetical protein